MTAALILPLISFPFDILRFPLWVLAIALFLLLPLCAFLGHRAGRAARRAALGDEGNNDAIVGEATSNAMMALLGLLLAFSFSFALNRAEERRQTLTEEVAAIGTAFLQADLLAEPGRSALRTALARYAETRLVEDDVARSHKRFDEFIASTLAAQGQLWPTFLDATAAGTDTPAPVRTAIAGGITEVLDAHTRRYSAAVQYIPPFAKSMILIVACTALVVASNSSALHGRELTWRTFLFAGLLSVVMVVILDFERPREGFVRIDNSQMKMLVAELDGLLQGD